MKKIIFISIFVLLSSNIIMAQDFFNPNKGLEPKTFGDISKGDGYEVRLRFESKPFESKTDIQLIYNGVPELNGEAILRFLDKDGFEIKNTTVFVSTMCDVENQNLTCRTDDNFIADNDYRKISSVSVSN